MKRDLQRYAQENQMNSTSFTAELDKTNECFSKFYDFAEGAVKKKDLLGEKWIQAVQGVLTECGGKSDWFAYAESGGADTARILHIFGMSEPSARAVYNWGIHKMATDKVDTGGRPPQPAARQRRPWTATPWTAPARLRSACSISESPERAVLVVLL